MSDLKTQFVTLAVKDGTTMQAYTASPAHVRGTLPAILVFQEAFGVNGHIRELTERFASQGYVAIAPELFHRTAEPGFEGSYTDFAALAPHFKGITTEGLLADAQAAWDWLQNNPLVDKKSIVSTGYCMGGRVSFLVNTVLPLKAAVSYYGAGIAPELVKKAGDLHAPMLFFWGGLDTHIPQEQIDLVTTSLKTAGKNYVNVVISDAHHGFFCDKRASYNEQAAKEAWALTLSFLSEKLKV